MKDGLIQNDERRVLMDDRLLGHRAFTDLSFTHNILIIQFRPFCSWDIMLFQIYLLPKRIFSV